MEKVPGRIPLSPLDLFAREPRVAVGERGEDEEGDEEGEEEEGYQEVVEERDWSGEPACAWGVCWSIGDKLVEIEPIQFCPCKWGYRLGDKWLLLSKDTPQMRTPLHFLSPEQLLHAI